jgi:hypothetical protein
VLQVALAVFLVTCLYVVSGNFHVNGTRSVFFGELLFVAGILLAEVPSLLVTLIVCLSAATETGPG